jgi:hypothetical protein
LQQTKVAELCEERYGQLLRQLDILESLHDKGLPVDVSACSILPHPLVHRQLTFPLPPKLPAPPDERYIFKEITQEDADWQGVFYQTEDGVEVPYSGKTISELMVKPQTLPLEAKRKLDGQPEGQPAAKVTPAAKGEDAVARHPAGLLGAAEAIEESTATTPDSGSNAPSPAAAPEPAEEAARHRPSQRVTSGAATPADGPELPAPRGATDPDEYGVRLISRRPTRMDIPNNRIMVPNLFDWDDLDIGFRDSTNCVQKGATKQRRGKYLGKPGSNYVFVDRRAGIWDATLAAGELDDELVKKHNLHPTLGLVLPGSVNEWEPPKPIVSGWKPVVFVPPNGEPIHASRTIEAARMDRDTEAVERRIELTRLVEALCEQEDISQEEVAPDPELVEANRTETLIARGIDPAQVAQAAQPEPASPTPEPAADDTSAAAAAFSQFVGDALGAADTIEEEEEAARLAAAKRSQPSRPYDAIRDVFTENRPARQPSPSSHQDMVAFVASLAAESLAADTLAADTTGLSRLADHAVQQPPLPPQPQPQPQPVVENPAIAGPAYYEQSPLNGVARPMEYEQPQAEYPQPRPMEYEQPQAEYPPPPEYPPPSEYPPPPEYPRTADYSQPEPAYYPRHDGPAVSEACRSNNFLRTALNPQSPPPPSVPPVQEYPGVPLAPTQGPMSQTAQAGRTPFSNTGAAKALPALRPMRSLLNEPPAYPEPQNSPALHHGSMVPSNTGAYFPPAAARPYHNGYSHQEQGQPMQPMMQQQQMTNPLQAPPLSMGSAPPRRMSTPPQYHQPSPLGPAPAHQMGAQPPMHFQGAFQGTQQPLGPGSAQGPRSRPGSSSAAANASAAASKYRKLEPAPTPPHRMSYSGNGQELRTVQFDYREAIKDYTPVEAPPRHGPTQIRGWTHNNIRKPSRPTTSPIKPDAGTHPDDPSA